MVWETDGARRGEVRKNHISTANQVDHVNATTNVPWAVQYVPSTTTPEKAHRISRMEPKACMLSMKMAKRKRTLTGCIWGSGSRKRRARRWSLMPRDCTW